MFPGYDENQLHHDVSILRGYLERVFTWHFIFIAPLPLLGHFLFLELPLPPCGYMFTQETILLSLKKACRYELKCAVILPSI